MKYVILPPQEIPKQETVHHRPKSLGEMKLAFLNANNRKSWADDEVMPSVQVPPSAVFSSRKKFVKALGDQKRLLKRREWERFAETLHTVPRRWQDAYLRSQAAAKALLQSPSPLLAAEYFTQHCSAYEAFAMEELAQYEFSTDIQEFIQLLDRKHVFGTRTEFSFRDLTE